MYAPSVTKKCLSLPQVDPGPSSCLSMGSKWEMIEGKKGNLEKWGEKNPQISSRELNPCLHLSRFWSLCLHKLHPQRKLQLFNTICFAAYQVFLKSSPVNYTFPGSTCSQHKMLLINFTGVVSITWGHLNCSTSLKQSYPQKSGLLCWLLFVGRQLKNSSQVLCVVCFCTH